MTNEEKARVLSVKASCETYFNVEAQKQYQNPSTETIARINAYGACMEMAKWKDEESKKDLLELEAKNDVLKSCLRDAKSEIERLRHRIEVENTYRIQLQDAVIGLSNSVKDLIKEFNI